MIRFLILFSFLANIFSVFPCMSLVAPTLSTLTPGQDKLSAKTMKRVFLGYYRLQQGYRCYSPDTHQYFVYVDVIFFENSHFFALSNVIIFMIFYCFLLSIHLRISPPHLQMPNLDHFKFILAVHVLTPSPWLAHLICRPPTRGLSCPLRMIYPLPYAKVLVLLVTLILFIIF